MIPRHAYFYWGGTRLSYLRYLTLHSFLRWNPNWDVTLFTPVRPCDRTTWATHEQKTEVVGRDYWDEAKRLSIVISKVDFTRFGLPANVPDVIRSDFLRLHLLADQGGCWSDMDILYLAPIDQADCLEADLVLCFHRYYSIGLMMSAGRSGFFADLRTQALDHLDLSRYQCIGSPFYKERYPSLSAVQQQFPSMRMHNLPMHVVYPWNCRQLGEAFEDEGKYVLPRGTVGIHWYAGSETAARFQNRVRSIADATGKSLFETLIRGVAQ